MTEEIELKHCPFCGGEAFLADDDEKNYGIFIACSKCCSSTGIFQTKDEALIAWNSRPIENELTGKIEKLEAENVRFREALQMIATEKDNHGQWLSVEQAAQIAKDTLDGELI